MIRFIGTWRPDEQYALRNAIREVEQFADLHVPRNLIGKRWVCRCIRESRGTVFSICHAEIDHPLWDLTFFGLLKKIYRLPWEGRGAQYAHPNTLFVHGR